MLRRVFQALRVLVFGLGLALLVWLPVSHFWLVQIVSKPAILSTYEGSATARVYSGIPTSFALSYGIYERTYLTRHALSRPAFSFQRSQEFGRAYTSITLPIWLLAAVCLAWPVTSFLVRRRRRGRGFEVEAKDGGTVPDAAGGRG